MPFLVLPIAGSNGVIFGRALNFHQARLAIWNLLRALQNYLILLISQPTPLQPPPRNAKGV